MNSSSAWSNKREDKTPWYQLDLGAVKEVAGVILAPREELS